MLHFDGGCPRHIAGELGQLYTMALDILIRSSLSSHLRNPKTAANLTGLAWWSKSDFTCSTSLKKVQLRCKKSAYLYMHMPQL
jgi:hypothetical protein